MTDINHDDRGHSDLGPSASSKWLLCAGSIEAEAEFLRRNPDYDDSNPAADEGTEAHEIADFILQNYHLSIDAEEFETFFNKPEWEHINTDMIAFAWRYADYCMALGKDDPDTIRATEQHLTMQSVHEDAFGTGDFSAYVPSTGVLEVVDLKYGKNVFVDISAPISLDIENNTLDVEANTQMLLYAEGQRIYLKNVHGIEPSSYRIHVYQPRMDNIECIEITPGQLAAFIMAARYRAGLARTPGAKRTPGDKQCFWCLAKPICKEHAARVNEIAARYFDEIDDADMLPGKLKDEYLTDEQVGELLDQWDEITKMGKALAEYAHARALQGIKIPGQKLAAGRAKYIPDVKALEFVLGDTIDIYKPPAMISKSELQKKLGKKVYTLVAEPFYRRIEGSPTLVPESDRRKEWAPENYKDDFEDE